MRRGFDFASVEVITAMSGKRVLTEHADGRVSFDYIDSQTGQRKDFVRLSVLSRFGSSIGISDL